MKIHLYLGKLNIAQYFHFSHIHEMHIQFGH